MADPDIEPEYDFRDSVPNPYADRFPRGPAGASMLLQYDEAADAAYLKLSDAAWHHRVRLDDARGINYAADGSVIGIEILSPRRKGVLLDGLPYPEDVTRVMRSVGFRIIELAGRV